MAGLPMACGLTGLPMACGLTAGSRVGTNDVPTLRGRHRWMGDGIGFLDGAMGWSGLALGNEWNGGVMTGSRVGTKNVPTLR